MQASNSIQEIVEFNTYPCITLTEKIGCGNLFGIFNFKHDYFNKVTFKCDMSKETDCGDSWIAPMSGILTFAIRRALAEEELGIDDTSLTNGIIKQLKHHKCNKRSIGKSESCADAIGKMIVRFMEIEHAKEEDTKK